MAKKDDTLDVWKYRYPSAGVSWKFTGDMAYCQRFTGEAKVMLYNLKNRMNLSASLDPAYRLKSLQDIRHYNDGTVIIVKSVYGQDLIEISAGVTALPPTCSITLYDVPESVQPMHWYLDGIQGGEVEGIDYIKTYYSFSVNNCPNCSSLDFTVCESEELATTYGWTAPQTCKPFTYQSENDRGEPILLYQNNPVPHHEGYPWADPPVPPDPMNHCIYGSCQAEIIKFGSDEDGLYFLWKIYTEWSTLGPTYASFTRSGLGYLLLRAFIKLGGQELCASASSVIKVDCCLKDSAFRPVIMFWEKCDLGWQWCPAPESNPYSDLMFFWSYGGWNMILFLMQAPTSQQFSCLPYTWTLSGPGEIIPSISELGANATYKIRTIDYLQYCGAITIEVSDRCGVKDQVVFRSCCEDAGVLGIGYTSLLMACNESQNFAAAGGCSPYTWSVSGSGTIVPDEDGSSALYTAPATNPGCNNVINLIDCCGNSAELKLAVNCYTGNDIAYYVYDLPLYPSPQNCGTCGVCAGSSCVGAGANVRCGCGYLERKLNYRCNAEYLSATNIKQVYKQCDTKFEPCPGNCPSGPFLKVGDCCDSDTVSGYCGEAVDARTQALIDASCCPINPETGLPF